MRALTFRKKEKLLGLAFIAPALILFLLFGVVRNTPWSHMYFY